MRFPPPIRLVAPLVALVFGLLATFFDYRLNLALDLARHLAEVRERADSSGRRLAAVSARLLAAGEGDALQSEVEAIPDVPEKETVAVVNSAGRILAGSSDRLRGQFASATLLAPASALLQSTMQPAIAPIPFAFRLTTPAGRSFFSIAGKRSLPRRTMRAPSSPGWLRPWP